jgi:NADPH:quinone reductase-like Zn-dependent oxidoreductase
MMSLRSFFCWLLVLKDLVASIFTLLFARLLPTINVPLIDLSNSTAIVTGANSGVGKSLCHELAKRNATVYLACRNVSKGKKVASEIIDACGESSSKRILSMLSHQDTVTPVFSKRRPAYRGGWTFLCGH